MKDITHKPESLRTAIATGKLYAPADALQLLKDRKTAKGDALEVARMAGIQAVKNTPQILPFCHPVMSRAADVTYDFQDGYVRAEASATVINSTGVEMEALTAVSATLLCIWDMLKPHTDQDQMHIGDIHLLKKTGGKSHYLRQLSPAVKVGVLATHPDVASGKKSNKAAEHLKSLLEKYDFEVVAFETCAGELQDTNQRLQAWLQKDIELIFTVGGTGTEPTDLTVEAVQPLLTKELPGLMETARQHGQKRTPYALMSRGIGGLSGNTVIVTLPGSTAGVEESFHALRGGLLKLVSNHRVA